MRNLTKNIKILVVQDFCKSEIWPKSITVLLRSNDGLGPILNIGVEIESLLYNLGWTKLTTTNKLISYCAQKSLSP